MLILLNEDYLIALYVYVCVWVCACVFGVGVSVFVMRPSKRASTAQGLSYDWSRRRAVDKTRPAFPKTRQHSSKKGCLRRRTIDEAHQRSLEARLPEAWGVSVKWHECWAAPGPTSGNLDRVSTTRDKIHSTRSAPTSHGRDEVHRCLLD